VGKLLVPLLTWWLDQINFELNFRSKNQIPVFENIHESSEKRRRAGIRGEQENDLSNFKKSASSLLKNYFLNIMNHHLGGLYLKT
jgi:hypothetical protein